MSRDDREGLHAKLAGDRAARRVGHGGWRMMRDHWKIVVLAGLALAGCTSEAPPPSTHVSARYGNEAHAVRLVDRSKFDARFQPVTVNAPIAAPRGAILVDTAQRYLYVMEGEGKARRYGIAVGAAGRAWSGTARVGRKAKWPNWYPTDEMRGIAPGMPREILGGSDNPLGARALYLYQGGKDTLYRIHGTSEPWTIGTEASSGCIRMLNEDAIELYDKVAVGATVIVR